MASPGRPRKVAEEQAPTVPDRPVENLGPVIEKKDLGKCPWCNKNGNKNTVVHTRHSWQCQTCGKDWEEESLGKEWSIEVERGKAWAKENAKRNA